MMKIATFLVVVLAIMAGWVDFTPRATSKITAPVVQQ
jgi:hypothetical protein